MKETQLELFPMLEPTIIAKKKSTKTKTARQLDEELSGSFVKNMSLPVHRWFRYSAGFSAGWVAEELKTRRGKNVKNVFDPFVGSGTLLLEAEAAGMDAAGVESHPFISRVAGAKLLWGTSCDELQTFAANVVQSAKRTKGNIDKYPELIRKCYPDSSLLELDRLRSAFEKRQDNSAQSKIVWLALTAILRECSPVGTAQWQYILPNKSKAKLAVPLQAFERRIQTFSEDMQWRQKFVPKRKVSLIEDDIRSAKNLPADWADLLITSPPYANNYDYADATRLEMSFWGEIESYGELQNKIRKYLVRACTQHVAGLKLSTQDILNDGLLQPIRTELQEACAKMDVAKESHGGKKPYGNMIASYFLDLAKAWRNIRKVMREPSTVCFVVGDSAPYGVYVPVDDWLGRLAVAQGFKSYSFEKTRDRNIKWKNRKHRVPLKEGRLWVKG